MKQKLCKHGLPMFQTCYDCDRIMVNEEPSKRGFKEMCRIMQKELDEYKKTKN